MCAPGEGRCRLPCTKPGPCVGTDCDCAPDKKSGFLEECDFDHFCRPSCGLAQSPSGSNNPGNACPPSTMGQGCPMAGPSSLICDTQYNICRAPCQMGSCGSGSICATQTPCDVCRPLLAPPDAGASDGPAGLKLAFTPAVSFATGVTEARAIVTGRVNGDAYDDLVVAGRNDAGGGAIVVLLGDGKGGFTAMAPLLTTSPASSVVIADIDGDGLVDVVAANLDRITVFRDSGKGDGLFKAGIDVMVGKSLGSMMYADFNSDNRVDLALTDGDAKLWVLSGTGGGNFTAIALTTGGSPSALAIPDLDGDGRPDLLAADATSSSLLVFFDQAGAFMPLATYPFAPNVLDIAVGDFNRDGRPDLAAVNGQGYKVFVALHGVGAPIYSGVPTTWSVGNTPAGVAVADFDRNTVDDIVATSPADDSIVVLPAHGDGTFEAGAPFTVVAGSQPHAVAVGDFDGDGKPDVATASFATKSISVFLNRSH